MSSNGGHLRLQDSFKFQEISQVRDSIQMDSDIVAEIDFTMFVNSAANT